MIVRRIALIGAIMLIGIDASITARIGLLILMSVLLMDEKAIDKPALKD